MAHKLLYNQNDLQIWETGDGRFRVRRFGKYEKEFAKYETAKRYAEKLGGI